MWLSNRFTSFCQHRTARAALAPLRALRRHWFRYTDAKAKKIFENFASLLVEDPVPKVNELNGAFALSSRSDLLRRILTTGYCESSLPENVEKHVS